jgi:hypothetical protein
VVPGALSTPFSRFVAAALRWFVRRLHHRNPPMTRKRNAKTATIAPAIAPALIPDDGLPGPGMHCDCEHAEHDLGNDVNEPKWPD